MRCLLRLSLVLILTVYPSLGWSSTSVRELPNGLKTIIFQDRTSPLISLQLWVSVGSTSEEDDEAGFAHFLEHLAFRSKDIAKRIEQLGGDINAYTSLEKTVYHLTIAREHLEEGLKVLADIFYATEFTEESFLVEKEVILEEMKRSYDSPQREIYKTFFEIALKDHPARRPVIGYEETIKQATTEKLYNFYNRFYVPENSFIVAVGDIKISEFIHLAQKLFSKEKTFQRHFKKHFTETFSAETKFFIKEKDISSCYLMVGFPTPGISSKEVPVIDVLSYIYGESSTSVLNDELKEKKELVNYIYSHQLSLKELGFFIIQSNFPCKNSSQVIEELSRILFEKPLNIEETSLKKVLKNYEANYYFSREKYSDIARDMGSSYLYFKDPDYSKKYIDLIRNVSKKELLNVKDQLIKPEKMTLVLLVPHTIDKTNLYENISSTLKSLKKQEEQNITTTILKNGIKIVAQKRTGQPTFAINLAALAGQRVEEIPGLSYLVASTFLRGTKNKSYKKIIEEIEMMGGSLNAYSTKNITGVSGVFLQEDFEKAITLITEILKEYNPKKEEIDKVKRLISEEIKRKKEKPTSMLKDIYFSNIYYGTSFANPTEGDQESLSNINQTDLIKAFYKIFSPQNLHIGISGHIPDNYLEILKKFFESIPTENTPVLKNIYPNPLRNEVYEISQFNQTHLLIGFIIPPLNSPLRANFHILTNILSNQSGRLFVNLRDKKGLAYSLGAFIFEFPEASLLNLYIATSPEKTETAKKELLKELKNIIREGITEEELTKAKNQIIFNMAENLQKNSNVVTTYLQNYIFFNNPLNHIKFQEEIKKVELKNLIEPIKEFLNPDKAIFVVLKGKS